MEFDINNINMTTTKLGVYAHSKIRFKSGDINPPVKASIPKEVSEKSGLWLWNDIDILSGRKKIGIRKTDVQKSNISE